MKELEDAPPPSYTTNPSSKEDVHPTAVDLKLGRKTSISSKKSAFPKAPSVVFPSLATTRAVFKIRQPMSFGRPNRPLVEKLWLERESEIELIRQSHLGVGSQSSRPTAALERQSSTISNARELEIRRQSVSSVQFKLTIPPTPPPKFDRDYALPRRASVGSRVDQLRGTAAPRTPIPNTDSSVAGSHPACRTPTVKLRGTAFRC